MKDKKTIPMIKTYQYRIYPTIKQAKKLFTWLEMLRNLYNQALAWRKDVYKTTGESVAWVTQADTLPDLKQASASFASLHSDVLQDALRRLDKAYQAFFGRVKRGETPGFPRFKGERRYRSMTFSHPSKRLIRNIRKRMACLVVPKLGHITIRYHRPLPDGKIKNLTIQRKASGWYANIAVEVPDTPEVDVETTIGIDVGLESFLTTSDGDKISNPRYFRTSEQQLGKSQRVLSRREKGSRRYNKQCEHVAKVHEYIANQRRDFHYKTAYQLFLQCEEVAVEDLEICNMVQNHHLSKSISDAGWGNFRLILQSKAANAGKQLTKVDPKYTSQKCSGCDSIVKSLFEKSFWAKLFARKPSFFFKTWFLPQSRKAYTIQTHIIIIFSKPCQINDRDLVFKPDGLGESTATPQCGSQWIAKSTALGNNLLLFKTGSKKSLSVRVHCCNDCGLVLDRDHNAAINIKKAAVALRGGVVVTNTLETPRQRKEAQNLVNPGETGNKPQPFRVG